MIRPTPCAFLRAAGIEKVSEHFGADIELELSDFAIAKREKQKATEHAANYEKVLVADAVFVGQPVQPVEDLTLEKSTANLLCIQRSLGSCHCR